MLSRKIKTSVIRERVRTAMWPTCLLLTEPGSGSAGSSSSTVALCWSEGLILQVDLRLCWCSSDWASFGPSWVLLDRLRSRVWREQGWGLMPDRVGLFPLISFGSGIRLDPPWWRIRGTGQETMNCLNYYFWSVLRVLMILIRTGWFFCNRDDRSQVTIFLLSLKIWIVHQHWADSFKLQPCWDESECHMVYLLLHPTAWTTLGMQHRASRKHLCMWAVYER